MTLRLPQTPTEWALAGALSAVALFVLYRVGVFEGHAVEIYVENATTQPIFAYLDNTGRHGAVEGITTLKTTENSQTPSGLVIPPSTTKSFGRAVGLGDSPTLHLVPIVGVDIADTKRTQDCAFDTVKLKLAMPDRHARLKFSGNDCEVSAR